ncbi:cbb3-type cytochrome oxidase assembly protein CcoS [Ralstonia sp. UBA689]|uniref:cbb3-type cytochrome oxidase assembly protein CcoS n=1 Tax=Ralstonia sp. UBA689 TaxID=1947373 RepID=UPI0025FF9ECD|nr:cbb3-type cytochrome oxidase assembly protein CcoS [Ralstonia sp. UBA689]
METLFLLIPLSLMLVLAIVGALWWAVGSGQYDDLKAPAESILLDPDTPTPRDTGLRD